MKPIKRAIALCWVMLVACFLIKLFGGNWFEVVCTNEHFIMVCDFIDNNAIIHQISSFLIYSIPSFFIITASSFVPKPTKKQFRIICVGLLVVWFSKFVSINLKSVFEILNTISMPIILNIGNGKTIKQSFKKYWYYGFLGYAIIFAFQFLSLFIRNIGITFVNESLFVTFILHFK